MASTTSADDEHVARAQAYPFDVPTASFVFAAGTAVPLGRFDPYEPARSTVRVAGHELSTGCYLEDLGLDPRAIERPRRPVLAAGSNAALQRLREKFGDEGEGQVIPVLAARVEGYLSVYAAHLAGYGAVPATLRYVPGATTRLFVTFLDDGQLARMDASEALGAVYMRARLRRGRVTLETGHALPEAEGYVSLEGCFAPDGEPIALAAMEHGGAGLEALREPELLERLRRLAAPELDPDPFVRANVLDGTARTRTERALRAWAEPLAAADFEPVRGGEG